MLAALDSCCVCNLPSQKAALFVFETCTEISLSPFQRVEHAKLAALWQMLLEHDMVDAQACKAWQRQCRWAWRPAEALEAQRLAERREDEPGFARNVWRDL